MRNLGGQPSPSQISVHNLGGQPPPSQISVRNLGGQPLPSQISVRNLRGQPSPSQISVRTLGGQPSPRESAAENLMGQRLPLRDFLPAQTGADRAEPWAQTPRALAGTAKERAERGGREGDAETYAPIRPTRTIGPSASSGLRRSIVPWIAQRLSPWGSRRVWVTSHSRSPVFLICVQ